MMREHGERERSRSLCLARGLVALLPALAGCVADTELGFGGGDDAGLGLIEQPLARSVNPPSGLSASEVPQFVAVTFDDGFSAEGVNWVVDTFNGLGNNPAASGNPGTFDGTPIRTSFYFNCYYLADMGAPWAAVKQAGHEIGDHTTNHRDGLNFSTADWAAEIDACRSQLATSLGLTLEQVSGFRAPYLKYNDALFTVLESRAVPFAYDTSIPSCLGANEDGTNCAWPYTLDSGSVDAANRSALNPAFGPINSHPGFWEIMNPVVIVPAEHRAGIPADQFVGGASTGKILGLDVSMFLDAKMNKAQSLAALKHTLDLHLQGNRAPFVFVAHPHVYASSWDGNTPWITRDERRAVLTEFIAYARTKPMVRMRPVADILAWMKSPVALGTCTPSCSGKACGDDGCGGSCGTCSGSDTCVNNQCEACVPQCSGKACGPDGCGGVCGTCAAGESCNSAGQCGAGNCASPAWSSSAVYGTGAKVTADCQVDIPSTACQGELGATFAWECVNATWCSLRPGSNQSGWWVAWNKLEECGGTCTPSCSGKVCGSDGCGGACGTCGAGQTCTSAGQCQSACTPSCSGKVCGADGCGGVCGTCGAGQTCTSAGQCQSTCTPSCNGKVCGADGCGGVCGTCGAGQTCTSAGQCEGAGGDCSAPAWNAGTSYGADAVVTATCTVSTVGTACYNKVGTTFAWKCTNPAWCSLSPGGAQAGWWSAWTSLAQCP